MRRLRQHLFGARPVQAVQACWPHQYWHALPVAEDFDTGIDLRHVLQDAWAKEQRFIGVTIARQRAAILGAALQVVEGKAGKALPR